MLYVFSVVASLQTNEPATAYFEKLREIALNVVQEVELSYGHAFNLCEYLDAVDSRAMDASRSEYSKCCSKLEQYLSDESNLVNGATLANKSWAAKTCIELLAQAVRPSLIATRQLCA